MFDPCDRMNCRYTTSSRINKWTVRNIRKQLEPLRQTRPPGLQEARRGRSTYNA